MLDLPLDAEQLVPHLLPMRMVDRLLAIDGKNGVVEAQVAPDCPLVDSAGCLDDIALIEMVAQSYAALKGYLDRIEGSAVRQGFLVGIKTFVRLETAMLGDRLRIEIKTLAELDDFAVAAGSIWRGETMVGHGEIKIWIH